jgi:replicative DNA helicase
MARKSSEVSIRRRHRSVDFRDTKLEIEFIAGIVHSKSIVEVVHTEFDSESITSDKLKWIYDTAIQLYLYDNQLLDTKTFHHMLSMKESKKKLYKAFWKKIQKEKKKTTIASTIACRDKLMKSYAARNIQIGLQKVIKDLEKAQEGDIDAISSAQEIVVSLGEQVQLAQNNRVVVSDPIAQYDTYKKRFMKIQKNPNAFMGVPTGIDKIDEYLLGLRRGEFGIVFGPTGGGKSITIMGFAIHAWRMVGNTVVVTIEMSKEQYQSRTFCNISGIEYARFRKHQISKKEWKLLDKTIKKAGQNPNQFRIIDMPEGCTVKSVASEIRKLQRKMEIHLVVIDYMNIMCGPSGKIDFTWQNQLEIAVQLKLDLARALDVPVWSACQVDDKGGAAFSKHIKDQLDVAGLLEHDDNSKSTGIMYWKWIKERDFKGEDVVLNTDLNHMRMTPLPDDMAKRHMKALKPKNKKKRVKV